MRTIKFRAQVMFPEGGIVLSCDKAEGECVYGDLHLQSRIPHIHSLGKKYPINPDTVGQFTGLYDKDGKEIYEGDIILEKLKRSRKDGDLHEIVFEDCQWFGKNKDGAATSLSLLNDFHVIKIIGNIYDNPELLK